jgi:hypothetical protein
MLLESLADADSTLVRSPTLPGKGPDSGRTDTVGAAHDDDPLVLKVSSFFTFENGSVVEAPRDAGWPR